MNKLLLAILVGIAVYCLMSKKPNNERLMWAIGSFSIIWVLSCITNKEYLNGDICNNHGNKQDGNCICDSNYIGPDCRYNKTTVCGPNGIGTYDSSSSKIICDCNRGYVGDQCQYSNLHNCNGNGTVTNDGICNCASGSVGSNCEYTNVSTCGDGITPHGTANDNGTCTCYPGYAGKEKKCKYSDSGTCNGSGSVDDDGTCSCYTGYAGTNCQCNTGYAGTNCQYSDVDKCGDGNTAYGTVNVTVNDTLGDDICDCNSGYAGVNQKCKYSDSITCNGNGTVTNMGTCNCNANYIGAHCSKSAN